MNQLNKIIKNQFCLGCGLCETIGKEKEYKMVLDSNGFYKLQFPEKRNFELETKMALVCPAVHLDAEQASDNVWGKVENVACAYATDPDVRRKGASGGVISAICIHLLEEKKVDSILHVGSDSCSYLYNSLSESISSEQIIEKASSRYAPAKVFNNLIEIFESSNRSFCFVGKPCDIQGLKNFISEYPRYAGRVKFYLAILCAGIPSYNATQFLLNKYRNQENPISLKYRGDGWPGFFKATYKDSSILQMTYTESWGKYLGRSVHFRCKICPDGIGLRADLAVGDAWGTKNGYPDFKEKDGQSFILVRTIKMQNLIQEMQKEGKLFLEKLDLNKIRYMQNPQYDRRITAAYKIWVVSFLSWFRFDFKNVLSVNFLKQIPIWRVVKIILGTITRSFNRNQY